jgi:hypothetical protein
VDLIAEVVASLLRGRPVIAQPVGFDDETEVRPVEVDLETVDVDLSLRLPEPGPPCDRQKETLEPGVGKREGSVVEGVAEELDPRALGVFFECSA